MKLQIAARMINTCLYERTSHFLPFDELILQSILLKSIYINEKRLILHILVVHLVTRNKKIAL